MSGCSLQLTRSELAASCGQIRKMVYSLQTLTAASISHVGIFGNASVNNEFDWIKVINNPPSYINDATV